ncbi:N-acetylmuramoyl-L-alanine amidase [Priestia megaterium]|uniref:N-acetylmuramoyl-L-alanine amidase n=1 Tax=Priestia megaterium TaxID=1404 RepID=UPI003000746A
MRVMIDAGHGGYDPGATSNGLKEKDLTLKLALDVAEDLESLYGIEVLLTRTEDVFISLEDRVLKANTAEVDYFVSLHHNAGGGTGFESYIYPGVDVKSNFTLFAYLLFTLLLKIHFFDVSFDNYLHPYE